MPAKRAAVNSSSSQVASPLWNAIVVVLALGFATWLVLSRNRLGWPFRELLTTVTVFNGCLAIAGPLILFRRGQEEQGVGDLSWMASGLLIWIFDLAAVFQGAGRNHNWTNPIDHKLMGLIVLAFSLAAWRQLRNEPLWSWTNVIGWIQSIVWVAAAVFALSGSATPSLFPRF